MPFEGCGGDAQELFEECGGDITLPFPVEAIFGAWGWSAVSDSVLRNPCFGMVMFQCTEPATKDTCRGVNPRRALLRHGQPSEAWPTLKQRRCHGFIKHCQNDTEKISARRATGPKVSVEEAGNEQGFRPKTPSQYPG